MIGHSPQALHAVDTGHVFRVGRSRNTSGSGAGRAHGGGFTIIELLVVIAIIAILAGLLFPALSGARKKARQINCASSLKNVGALLVLYASNHEGWYPSAWNTVSNNNTHWTAALIKEFPGEKETILYGCPSRTDNAAGSYAMNDFAEVIYRMEFSPAINEAFGGKWTSSHAVKPGSSGNLRSSSLLFIADHGSNGGNSGWTHPVLRSIDSWEGGSGDPAIPDFRHPDNKKNVLFFDFHIEVVGVDGLDDNLLRVP